MVSAHPAPAAGSGSRTGEVRQPFGPPSSRAEERAWRDAGLLVDTAGSPLPATGTPCGFCDGSDLGDTCPGALTCPKCKAPPGRHCRRPSEWETSQWHAARVQAADLEDQRREDAGDGTMPARWAST
ncbi:zinc finger domain-containing protein [Streptacidiphilus jiangxiensis]|uniref:DNA-binding phage zinc finger domain-containing protein n=1 Tax=Streptacidiphilus jiangxiensis TaxID=235985 RepID=A0A1H8B6F5_STRJI|nr:hypothetical protein [Streptacidiphilus jiangxiensis]SEM77628.1 hypothetical protein SAMN05414137_1574 [Streptacidiphilus jiangxiensis]